MSRDINETVYRILVSDIHDTAENYDLGELSDEVVDKVCYKLEAMDFGNLSETIKIMIEDAKDDLENKEYYIDFGSWAIRAKNVDQAREMAELKIRAGHDFPVIDSIGIV